MRLEKESVMEALRAVGSRDPDVLRDRVRSLARPVRVQEAAGIGLVSLGVVAAFVAPGPVVGVPVALLGWLLWRRGTRNVAALEAGYVEFVRSPLP